MPIFKFSNAGGMGAFTRYNDFLAGNPTGSLDLGSMIPIGVVTAPSAGLSTISFTNIPQTFQHLHIRGIARCSNSNAGIQIIVPTLNNDTTSSNYAKHHLIGNGTNASSYGGGSDRGFDVLANANYGTNAYTAFMLDILDYSATNKSKTMRMLSGVEDNSTGRVILASNLWTGTAAVTSISFTAVVSSNFIANSTFAMYGVRG